MKGLFGAFARHDLFSRLITVLVFMIGIATLMQINRAQYPKVDLGEMVVTTAYPGAAPEDVELNVTNRIEEELKGIDDIKRYNSVSQENVSRINIFIDPDAADPDRVKQDIRDAVNRVTDFPEEVTDAPLITDVKSDIFPVLELGLTGKLPYGELREYARRFEKRLKDIPGVARVTRFGYRDREIQVELDPERLRELQLPTELVVEALRNRNVRSTGGSLESFVSEQSVVTLAQFRDPDEVRGVVVRSTFDGPDVTIADIATITDSFEEEVVLTRLNGLPAISFQISKGESADIIRVVEAIRTLIADEEQLLPEGAHFVYGLDVSQYVEKQLSIVMVNGLIGLALVLLMLSFFLNIRAAFWVALGIPFTLLGTIALLPLFEVDLDSITLTSMIIVIGIVVDDAIIVSENIFRRRELGEAPLEAVVNGITQVSLPVVVTIVTTMTAFAPMFFMPGVLGKFVFVIPLTISVALLISLVEAFLILPAHIRHSLEGERASITMRNWFQPWRERFERLLFELLRFRYALVLFGFLTLGGAIWYGSGIGFILFPPKGAELAAIWIEMPPGSSLKATSSTVAEFEALIDELPEGERSAYLSRIGMDGDYLPVEQKNFAAITLYLTPYAERSRTAEEIVEELRRKSEAITGPVNTFFYIDSGGPPVGRAVTIRAVGSNDTLRTALADSVAGYLSGLQGITAIDRDDKQGKEQVEIGLHYRKMARLGLSVADIARSVRIAYDGEVATSVRYGEEDVDFRVMLDRRVRRDIGYLGELMVLNSSGRVIPLSQVATFRSSQSPSRFNHYDGERSITLSSDVDEAVLTPIEAMRAVQERFNLSRDFPGVKLVYGGEAQESEESLRSLFIAFGLAAIGIYFLLVLLFGSYTQPLLVMMAIPFGIIGVVISFALHGEVFSFLGLLGVVGMAGVVVNDSLVLVSHINERARADSTTPVRKLLAGATADRLRAVILTTATTAAGLLPLAYGIGGTDVFMMPMALALGWGLLFATPLTLVLIPCLYLIGSDIRQLFTRNAAR